MLAVSSYLKKEKTSGSAGEGEYVFAPIVVLSLIPYFADATQFLSCWPILHLFRRMWYGVIQP